MRYRAPRLPGPPRSPPRRCGDRGDLLEEALLDLVIAHNHGRAAGSKRIGKVPGADARFLRIDPVHQPVDLCNEIPTNRLATVAATTQPFGESGSHSYHAVSAAAVARTS